VSRSPSRAPRSQPIWRETRVGLEAASLRRSDVWRGIGVEPGEDRPGPAHPGLPGRGRLAGDHDELAAPHGLPHEPCGDPRERRCSEAACSKLEERLERLADRHGDRVSIIGQSRGGLFAKALASRRPDLVSGIVTLGSPITNMLAVNPLVLAQIGVVGALGTLAMPGMLTARCFKGRCCERFREALEDPFPDDVGYLSVYSRSDGIVDWHACLDPEADELMEVRASHCGMGVNAATYRAVAHALSAFGAELGHPAGAERFAQAA
jgi:pimeloyl-ACP methyl ester carboxylesterase